MEASPEPDPEPLDERLQTPPFPILRLVENAYDDFAVGLTLGFDERPLAQNKSEDNPDNSNSQDSME